MSVTYGYQTRPRDDPLVRIVENALFIGLEMMTQERAILLRLFPLLAEVARLVLGIYDQTRCSSFGPSHG